jgi:pentapeptide MXKDX repeat protein
MNKLLATLVAACFALSSVAVMAQTPAPGAAPAAKSGEMKKDDMKKDSMAKDSMAKDKSKDCMKKDASGKEVADKDCMAKMEKDKGGSMAKDAPKK